MLVPFSFQIYNLQSSIKDALPTASSSDLDVEDDEVKQVMNEMRKEDDGACRFIRNISLTSKEYSVTCFFNHHLEDIEKFCVDHGNILVMDTTFDLCNMWVTDTAYQNLRIVTTDGFHPWFFGPLLLHMRKLPTTFSRFCLELLVENPALRHLPCLGTDLEKALYGGFKAILPSLKSLLCVKHMSDRDKKKLTKLNAKGKREILHDIYGISDGVTRELGLASAEDEEDFKAKLDSLKVTSCLVPGRS